MGTTAIVSDILGPKDVIQDGEIGLLCDARDSYSLLRCMKRMIENQTYIQLGKNAEKHVKEKYDSKILCEYILRRKENLLGIKR